MILGLLFLGVILSLANLPYYPPEDGYTRRNPPDPRSEDYDMEICKLKYQMFQRSKQKRNQ
jgi:hypothetical protein